jgi:Uma2 family endonuclease
MRDIVLPEAEPALEWIGGRVVQKVSPQRKHALAQMRFAIALEAWGRAGGRGTVGTEREFRLKPPGEVRRPLVPDVAFISFDRLQYDDDEPLISRM